MVKTLLYLFCILVTSSIALACSCIQPGSPQESLDQATAVFVGKVIEIQPPILPLSSTDPIKVTFEVSQVWKGDITQTTIVKTAQDSASCGYLFELGQEYIVYTYDYNQDGDLATGLCTRTALLSRAQQDVDALGTNTLPSQNRPEGLHPILRISLMGVAVLIIALILFHFKHKPTKK
ncbi:hypothetical protein HYV86_03070 [Candidatus Woesearchaeota archaeon]|nr:hypothetical protein [Candidatus Woesearchaeota archaeon]